MKWIVYLAPRNITMKASISGILKRYKFACILLIAICLNLTGLAQSDIAVLLSKHRDAKTLEERLASYSELFDYYQYSNPDSSNYYIREGLKIFTAQNSKEGIATMTMLLGDDDGMHGHMELAKKRQMEALQMFEEIKNKSGIAAVHNGLGVLDGKQGRYDSATHHFTIALKTYDSAGNKKGIVSTYLKLGVVNELNNNFSKALEYYNKALQLSPDSPLSSSKVYIYNNLGIVYAKMGDLKKSLDYFKNALEKSDKPQFTGVRILSLMNIGIVYEEFKNDKKALEYLNQALQITKDKNLPENEARIMVNIASVTSNTDVPKGIAQLKEALVLAKSINQKSILRDIYAGLSEDYQQIGDYKNAVAIMEEQKKLEQSIFSIEKAKEIANLQAVFELEESNDKIKDLKLAEQRNAQKRNAIVVVAALLAVALILISIFFRRARRLNEQLTKREMELEKSNRVKDKLFSIIGHDLRGPVGNIPAMLTILEDEATSPEERKYLMATLMDHSQASLETLNKLLYWGRSQIKNLGLTLETFKVDAYIENNIKLVKSSADQKQLTISNEVSGDIEILADAAHFDFIVRNLLSNAIKFTHNYGSVTISADKNKKPGHTVFCVKDTGVGIGKEKIANIFEPFSNSTRGTADERGTSIGLMLCKEFMVENGGEIWVESEVGKGSAFYFSFKNA